jgi:hypothetical protein
MFSTLMQRALTARRLASWAIYHMGVYKWEQMKGMWVDRRASKWPCCRCSFVLLMASSRSQHSVAWLDTLQTRGTSSSSGQRGLAARASASRSLGPCSLNIALGTGKHSTPAIVRLMTASSHHCWAMPVALNGIQWAHQTIVRRLS